MGAKRSRPKPFTYRKQKLWLRCRSCNLILRCPDHAITLTPHYTADAKKECPGRTFELLPELDEETAARALAEENRRRKKHELLNPKGGAARRGVKGVSRWDGVRSTTARPSRGSAGLPSLGKR